MRDAKALADRVHAIVADTVDELQNCIADCRCAEANTDAHVNLHRNPANPAMYRDSDHRGRRTRPAVRRLASQAAAGDRWAHAPRAERRSVSRPSVDRRGGGRPSADDRPGSARVSSGRGQAAAPGRRRRAASGLGLERVSGRRAGERGDPDSRRRAAVRVRRADRPDDRGRRGPRRRDRGARGQRHGEARRRHRRRRRRRWTARRSSSRRRRRRFAARCSRRPLALGQSGVEATDEAALAERAGYAVHVVPGESTNIKITTPEDLDAVRSRRARPGDEPAAPEWATICTGSSRGVRSSSAA